MLDFQTRYDDSQNPNRTNVESAAKGKEGRKKEKLNNQIEENKYRDRVQYKKMMKIRYMVRE